MVPSSALMGDKFIGSLYKANSTGRMNCDSSLNQPELTMARPAARTDGS